MHENSGNSVIYYAHYTEDGVNKTGLTVTITVYEVIRDGTKTEVVTDGACTEIGDGLYRYLLASGTVDAAAEYVAVFHTATDTVDAQDIPAIWVIDRAGTEKLDNGVTLADDAITASKFDESTAYPLKSADTGATQVARVGADSDTLETLSDQLDAAATASSITALDGKIDTIDNFLDTEVADILADTNEIQAELADGGRTDLLIDAIKAKTDNLPADPADDSDIDAQLAAIKAETAAILVDTGTDGVVVASGQTVATVTNLTNLPTMPADWVTASGLKADAVTEIQSGLALEATLTAIKGAGWTTETLVTLKAYVDEIETRLTATRAGYLDKLNVTGTLAHSDAAATYKADVSGLAPANEYDAELTAMQADLDNPDQYKADVSGLATSAEVGAIDTDTVMSFMIDGFTFEQIIQIMASVLAGKLTRSGDTLTFRDLADTVNRVVAETDANKQRTTMTYTV